ncbi:hypothetical protein [Nocardiopsis sp. NPDC057823]|uniref:hypothetical protein n=1 Tax=Nocardiopsis sp. NPDC057823 TaxID=3346256 RepID=UPI00366CB7AC
MGFKTWLVGEVLKAADVNAYLAKQVIAVVTSGTRPPDPVEGQMIYETDTKSLVLYTGSVWETLLYHGPFKEYTPLWTADSTNPSIGNGTLNGKYRRLPGRVVELRLTWARGSTTNMGSGPYAMSLPTNLPAEVGTRWFGIAQLATSTADTTRHAGHAMIFSGSTGAQIDRFRFDTGQASGNLVNWSDSAPATSTGAFMHCQIFYETTSLESEEV